MTFQLPDWVAPEIRPQVLAHLQVKRDRAVSGLRERWARSRVVQRSGGGVFRRVLMWFDANGQKPFVTIFPTFVVQHNFGEAVATKTDEWPDLPYPTSVFEMRVSGHDVLMVAEQVDNDCVPPRITILVEFDGDWIHASESEFPEIVHFVSDHVRGLLICLSAGILTVDAHCNVDKRNASLIQKGKRPFNDFHTVRLLPRRSHATPFDGPQSSGGVVRLHFRRANEATYNRNTPFEYKVKRPWCLVGNPDLGFVDKLYTL